MSTKLWADPDADLDTLATALYVTTRRLAGAAVGLRGAESEVPHQARQGRGFSYCLSEPDAGSDAAGIKARDVRDGDHWVLNGVKRWITNAGVPEYRTVMAVTDPEKRTKGISAFVRQQAAVLFVAVGLVWAFRSLQAFSDPHFSDPQSLNDWVAVVTLSLATWLLAPALLVLPQPPSARWPARAAAAAAVVVGLANLLEDGLGVEAAGIGFGLGNAVLLLGCVAMSLVCLVRSPRWAAVVPAGTAVGLLLLESGGGLLCLAVWCFAAWRVTRA